MEHNNDENFILHGVYHYISNGENIVVSRESIVDDDGDELICDQLACGCLHYADHGAVFTSNDC